MVYVYESTTGAEASWGDPKLHNINLLVIAFIYTLLDSQDITVARQTVDKLCV